MLWPNLQELIVTRIAALVPASQRIGTLTKVTLLVAIAGSVFAANGQDTAATADTGNTPAATTGADNATLLADFIHYVKIQNYDLAEAMGNELLGKGLDNAAFITLVEANGEVARFEDAVQRAMRVGQLEKVAAGLSRSFETGKLERARTPDQIAKNIELLTGTDRGRRLGEERLVYAGEYALPQLIEAFLDRSKATRQAAVTRVIVGMGRQAVLPLVTTMMSVPAAKQEQIADLLGQIPYRTSLPFLRDIADSTNVEAVRNAANRAIDKIAANDSSSGRQDAGTLYRTLAEGYYVQRADLTSFPGEDNQLLWSYEPSTGLVMTAVKTPVYHEAMAMRLAERALQLEAAKGTASPDTLALWVASNFSREIDTPQGYENPAYVTTGDKARRSAEYFGVAAGADVAQRVLGRAIADRDTPLARRAIAAVEKTAGSKDLWASDANGTTPLQAALNYPNRRVQFDAALALAAAQPQSAFAGSDRVVPTLAATVSGATTQYAVVLAADAEQYQTIRGILNKNGYNVLPQGRSMADLTAPLSETPSVDLVVSAGSTGSNVVTTVDDVRGQVKTLATPILVLTDAATYTDLSRRYASDSGVAVRQSAIGEAAIVESVQQVVNTMSGGPITQEEAAAYSGRALAALRDLAVSGNTVLTAGDASSALISALPTVEGDTKMKVAEILSRINQDRAQRAVMTAALAASGDERVALLSLVGDSGKRFGNYLEAAQVAKLSEMAAMGADGEATAAAGLIGALNLGRTELVPMIIKQ